MTVQTWHFQATVNWVANRVLLALASKNAAAHTHKIFRLFQFNNQTSAVSGAIVTMQIGRDTLSTPANVLAGGTGVTPVAHDTGNTALSGDTVVVHGGSGAPTNLTGSPVVFRTYQFCNTNPTVTSGRYIEWLTTVPAATIFDAGFGDSNEQPLTVKTANGGTAEALVMKCTSGSLTGAGTSDIEGSFGNE